MTEESTHYNEFVLMFHFLRRLCFVISGIFNAFRSDVSARIIQQTTALENCSKLLASSPSARNRVCVYSPSEFPVSRNQVFERCKCMEMLLKSAEEWNETKSMWKIDYFTLVSRLVGHNVERYKQIE